MAVEQHLAGLHDQAQDKVSLALPLLEDLATLVEDFQARGLEAGWITIGDSEKRLIGEIPKLSAVASPPPAIPQ